jgi:hypothetical protein
MAAASPPPRELSNEPSSGKSGAAVDRKRRPFHHLSEAEKTLVLNVAGGLKRWRADGSWTGIKDPARKQRKRADVAGGAADLTGFARSTVLTVLAGAGNAPLAAPPPPPLPPAAAPAPPSCRVPDSYLYAFARDFFGKNPHLHVHDLTKAIVDATGKAVSDATVWRGLVRLGFTFGRPPFPRNVLHESERVIRLRHGYLTEFRKNLPLNNRLVFLGESFFVVGERSPSVWHIPGRGEHVDIDVRKGDMLPCLGAISYTIGDGGLPVDGGWLEGPFVWVSTHDTRVAVKAPAAPVAPVAHTAAVALAPAASDAGGSSVAAPSAAPPAPREHRDPSLSGIDLGTYKCEVPVFARARG